MPKYNAPTTSCWAKKKWSLNGDGLTLSTVTTLHHNTLNLVKLATRRGALVDRTHLATSNNSVVEVLVASFTKIY